MITGRRRQVSAAPWIDLCVKILDRCPPLRGAACIGHAELFDGDGPDGERTRAALAICRRCPVREECRAWAATQPSRRMPRGVLAGRWRGAATQDEGITV